MEILIVGFLVLNAALLAFVLLRKPNKPDETGALLIKHDLTTLAGNITDLKDGLQKQLDEKLNQNNKQMVAQFSESAKIIKDVTEKLTKLEGTNKSVGDIANELKMLQNVLQNPKQRGVIGEFYLDQILKNTLPPGAYQLQYKLGESLVVDAAIILDDKILPVDSKFSLENYNRLLDAKPGEQEVLAKSFKEDLKRRIDETAKYILPGKGTLDQALMFIPSEAIYYDLLANKVGLGNVSGRNLIQYASEKKVTIVGPSTLSAMLQTIMQGLRSIEIHKDTEKIRKNIEQLGKHLIAHNAYMQKLGSSLVTKVNHYNATYKELGKVDRDIIKITDSGSSVEPLLLDKPIIDD